MYARVESNVSLLEGVKGEALAESFDPHSPLSGLSDEQADRVDQRAGIRIGTALVSSAKNRNRASEEGYL